jgi:hypothetical protein
MKENDYFWGEVYQGHWIVDSVKEGSLLDKDQYLSMKNSARRSLKIDFSK